MSQPTSQPPTEPTPSHQHTEPLDVDGVRTAVVGTIVWAVAFVVLLPFAGRLADDDRTWWLWTCVAGVGLGLLATWVTSRRRNRLRSTAST